MALFVQRKADLFWGQRQRLVTVTINATELRCHCLLTNDVISGADETFTI